MIDVAGMEIEPKEEHQNAEEILRCLRTLYGTTAGEQALDRDFGLDANCIDAPMPAAKPLFVAEIVKKTKRYEPRARVLRVEWDSSNAHGGAIKPKVVIEFV